jgi:hypothetical protein
MTLEEEPMAAERLSMRKIRDFQLVRAVAS